TCVAWSPSRGFSARTAPGSRTPGPGGPTVAPTSPSWRWLTIGGTSTTWRPSAGSWASRTTDATTLPGPRDHTRLRWAPAPRAECGRARPACRRAEIACAAGLRTSLADERGLGDHRPQRGPLVRVGAHAELAADAGQALADRDQVHRRVG